MKNLGPIPTKRAAEHDGFNLDLIRPNGATVERGGICYMATPDGEVEVHLATGPDGRLGWVRTEPQLEVVE